MTLSRRTLLLAGAGLLAAGPAAAIETTWGSKSGQPWEDHGGSKRGDFMPFKLKGNKAFTARQILVVTDAGAYGGDFTGQVFVRDENKIGIVKDIPLVGALFDQRLRGKDFDPNQRIGTALQLGDTLVIDLHVTKVTLQTLAAQLVNSGERPTSSLALPEGRTVQAVVAANDFWSYTVGGKVLNAVDPAKPPAALAALASGITADQVGEAYRHPEGALLVLVRPSILTGWS
ncbi:MAG TPA: hypothetical protein VJL84_04775 [Kiloniellales bacterium]|nr:hypothetical protein [Kiloniellales bacterium]